MTVDEDRLVTALFGMPGASLWAKQIGGSSEDEGNGIAMDGDGNLIAVGGFSGTANIGGTELVSMGAIDAYVAKVSSSTGDVIWAKRFGGTFYERGIQATSEGLTTYISITSNDPQAGTTILSLDANGSVLWERKITTTGDLSIRDIAARDGSVAAVGFYSGTVTVGAQTFTAQGDLDVLVLKLTQSGATTWARSFGAALTHLQGEGVALDSGGNVAITGAFASGSIDFGGALLGPVTKEEVFLVKLASNNGGHLFSNRAGGSSSDVSYGLDVDAADNIIIAGGSYEPQGGTPLQLADFGCGTRVEGPIFVAKYSPAGACLWSKGVGDTTPVPAAAQRATAVSVNSTGQIAITGSFCGTLSLGGRAFTAVCDTDITPDVFAARLSANGEHLHSVRAGGLRLDSGRGIAHGSDGRFFVTGRFGDFAEFGGRALEHAGSGDGFIAGFPPQ